MDTLQLLQTAWFFLLGFLLIGYSILDGFDLGVGMLLPFIARDRRETATLLTSIGPVWDGNEVWLVTAGGALFAAFPQVYATVFSGFYLALMLVLFALIFRAVSLEFWTLDENRRGLWKWSFAAGSFLPSLFLGIALGNVITGIPLDKSMEFTGTFFTLLRPLPIGIGLLGFVAIMLQGSTYIVMKTTGPVHDRARKTAGIAFIAYCSVMAVAIILSAIYLTGSMGNPAAWLSTVVVIASLVIGRISLGRGGEMVPFFMSSLAFLGLWCIAGSLQFPTLVRALGSRELDLTVYNSSSGALALSGTLAVAVIGMPIVIGYTIFAYRLFRGKVELSK